MGHVVVVEKIKFQRTQELFWIAVLEAGAVVDPGVVYEHIEASEIAQRSLDRGSAISGR